MTKAHLSPLIKWSNPSFLDDLRQQGDQLADHCLWQLEDLLPQQDFSIVFKELATNAAILSDSIPEPLKDFLRHTMIVPSLDGHAIDTERLVRGQRVFMTHALPSALVLLAKSLPEGYAAPPLSRILSLSDNLSQRPYRRLLGVLQMVINVLAVGGFEASGKAIVTAPKIRLLHAGVRHIVKKHLPTYQDGHGVPVNLEDMLGTVMGFSYLVICGLRTLEVGLSQTEEEDLYYVWRVFAQMMGIHPEGQPHSCEYVPSNLEEARVFYEAYRIRHYVDAVDNPEGVELACSNLQMLNDLLPQTPLRRLGLNVVPRIYMEELMGKEGCARIGIQPVRFFKGTKWLLKKFPWAWSRLWNVVDRVEGSQHHHENLSRLFFQGLINREYNGEVTFHIPDNLEELKKLA